MAVPHRCKEAKSNERNGFYVPWETPRMFARVCPRSVEKSYVYETKKKNLAGTTGLEPATSDVTGRRSNQLNYVPLRCELRRQCHLNISFELQLEQRCLLAYGHWGRPLAPPAQQREI
jgi:hypothetical protein